MQNTQFKTSKQTFTRAAEACLRRFTTKLQRLPLAAGRAGVACLLLCGSFIEARAQVVSDPNDMGGFIEWNNPAGPVRDFLLNSLNHSGLPGGFGVFDLTATPTVPGSSVDTGYVGGTGSDPSTRTYGIRVQGRDDSGTAP